MDDPRSAAGAAVTCHNTHPITLYDLTIPSATDPLSRRELACFRARFLLWRREWAERIRRQIEADPRTPVAGDQRMVRLIDDAVAAIDRQNWHRP